ncbi:MAG: neutral zinc metallopeptidase [Tissierellia bacterium]|nr:neutral zinc metallopeptidase [Tissierellia bacterium]
MRWQDRRRSSNVVDRRGSGRGIGGGIRMGGAGLIIVAVLYTLMGGNPLQLVPMVANQPSSYVETAEDAEKMEFIKVILADTEDVWKEVFNEYQGLREQGVVYKEPKLVVFHQSIQSACGMAGAAMGPFYCPGDQTVYLDLSFFDKLKNELGASGDFAIAYVISHEIGHHVQNLLGILQQQQALREKLSPTEYNKISVRIELMADYFAGVFTRRIEEKGYLDVDDLEEAINAAGRVGDDVLQKQYQGRVVPDSFTHGSAEMRVRWFMKGYNTGDLRNFDTFQYEYDEL